MPELATRETAPMSRYLPISRKTSQVTAERVKLHFGHLLLGEIQRFVLPQLHGINLVMDEALGGGVNESLNLDSHGKSWSFLILSLSIELDGEAPPSSNYDN